MAEKIPLNACVHYDPIIANEVGINAAIILSRIVWSINKKIEDPTKNARFFVNERYWMHDSAEAFCEYSGMSRHNFNTAIRKLKDADLIFTDKMHKKTLDHTTYYAVNTAVYLSLFNPETPIVRNTDNRISETRTIEYPESVQSNIRNPYNVTKNPTKNLSENLTKSQGGEEAAIAVPPPIGNLISFPSKDLENEITALEDEIEALGRRDFDFGLTNEESKREGELLERVCALYKLRPSISNKTQPPEPPNSLSKEWHSLASEGNKSANLDEIRFELAIQEILEKTKYSLKDLPNILKHIASGRDPMLKRRFKFPWQWNWEWEKDGLNFLDEAHASMNSSRNAKTGNRKFK